MDTNEKITGRKKFGFFMFVTLLIIVGMVALSRTSQAQEASTKAPLIDVDTSFTYQGEIEDGGGLVDGSCDFRFGLWDAASAGLQLGSTQFVGGVVVNNGRFTTTLNNSNQFGANAFNGAARWLQIDIRCPAGSGNYTPLSPRQPLTAAPYAQSLLPGAVVSGAVPGQMLTAVNTAGDGLAGLSNAFYFSGVYGQSDHAQGYGVYGRNTTNETLAYLGGSHNAVYAEAPSASGDGLSVGFAGDNGVFVNIAGNYGVYLDIVGIDGVYVDLANNDGVHVNSAHNDGVHVESALNDGVYANTIDASDEWGFYTPDKSHSSNYTFTSLSLIVQVGAGKALTPGDLVSVISIAAPISGSSVRMPIVQLASSTFPNVIGVVEKRMELVAKENVPTAEEDEINTTGETQYAWRHTDGIAGEGDYISLTVYGIADVKIDAQTATQLQAGQRLTADNNGKARVLKDVIVDGVLLSEGAPSIGYVLETPAVGATAVPIFVTLR